MGSSAACCIRREEEESSIDRQSSNGLVTGLYLRSESWHSIADPEESWSVCDFDECQSVDSGYFEQAAQPHIAARRSTTRRSIRPLALVPEEARAQESSSSSLRSSDDARYLHLLPVVAEGVRHVWAERLANKACLPEDVLCVLQDGFPELDEWTRPEKVRRILRAIEGDLSTATKMLVKAVEMRVIDRRLYKTLRCEVTSDIRVIGRDTANRPVVYVCCQNQRRPLKESMLQIFLAFEVAVKMAEDDGQILLIADMRGFSPKLNMDPRAINRVTDTLGTVFADRMHSITVVDFSFIAQSVWSFCKPLLLEKTRKKISFVSERKAREELSQKLQPHTFDRIVSAFDINRDKSSTPDDRQKHAVRTSICDVPLGYSGPRLADDVELGPDLVSSPSLEFVRPAGTDHHALEVVSCPRDSLAASRDSSAGQRS